MYEIELKAHVQDRKKTIKNLEKFASFYAAVEKYDSYYENLINGKTIKVRIRKEIPFSTKELENSPKVSAGKSVIFTYKQKEMHSETGVAIEVNNEHEAYLSDAEPLESFLKDTGFSLSLTKHKTVLSWQFDGILLELCNVERLGDFIEIEVLTETNDSHQVEQAQARLRKLLSKCEIPEDKIEKRYYSQMLEELKK